MMTARDIFVVHGALGSAAQMEPLARALAALGTVHNVELPGHGNTPLAQTADFSMSALAESVRLTVERLTSGAHQSRPVVFGYSMGGYVALALESQHPGTFAAIITLGTKFAWTPALALRELSRLDANVIQEKVPKYAAALMTRHTGPNDWKRVLENTASLLTQLGDAQVLTKASLGAVQSRVCITVGELDDTVSTQEAAEYASFIPGANTRVITGAPHPIERVAASDIVDLVRETIPQ